ALWVSPLPRYPALCGNKVPGALDDSLAAVLQSTAVLSPIAIRDSASSTAGVAAPGYAATGNGFIFYLAGHFTMMQMAALPAAGTVWHVRSYSGNVPGSAGNY